MLSHARSIRRILVRRALATLVCLSLTVFLLAVLFAGSAFAAVQVTTVAGAAGEIGTANGTGTAARFSDPSAICYDPDNGCLYVSDSNAHTIRQITAAGVVTTIAGLANNPGYSDGTGAGARFNQPYGICYNPVDHCLYVADSMNNVIRRVTTTGQVTTFAGDHANYGERDGTGTAAWFMSPNGICYDSYHACLFVCDASGNVIRKITAGGGVTTIAGNGRNEFLDGTGASAAFNVPWGITYDSADHNLYVADYGNNAIRRVTAAGVVTTLAGTGTTGSANGAGTVAQFNHPTGLCYDSANGYLYVADTGSHTIRQITSAGWVTTVAGHAGAPGHQDGTGTVATFCYPYDICYKPATNDLYVADTINATVRKIDLPPVPVVTSVTPDFGMTAGAVMVQITGTGFTGATAVRFGSTNATSVSVGSATSITCVAPPHAAGVVSVSVVTPTGVSSTAGTANDYVYLAHYEETASQLAYSSGWNFVSTPSAWAGADARSNASGSYVRVPFNGTRLDWIAARGLYQGKADVYLDGVFKTTVNLYNPGGARYRERVYTTGTLAAGYHLLQIKRSTTNTATAYINLDAVEVAGSLLGQTTYQENDGRLMYDGIWTRLPSTGASGGYVSFTDDPDGSVTIPFEGMRISIQARQFYTYGQAWISVDDGAPTLVDLYGPGPGPTYGTVWTSAWLAPGMHYVIMSRAGTHSAGSTGYLIDIDSVKVVGILD